MIIPLNIIFPWNGNHVSIPTGWSRETTLDNRYPKASGSETPNIIGGATTHTHTSPTHSHTMVAHSHNIQTTTNSHEGSSTGEDEVLRNTKNGNHYHNGLIPISTSSISSTSVTYGTCSNDPSYYTVIYLKSTGGNIPNDLIAYYNAATPPNNWYFCNGANTTPDLRNVFLKGASTGANAGTYGGSTTNIHAISHGHTDSHAHYGGSNGNVGGSVNKNTNSGPGITSGDHGHQITLDSVNGSVSSTISLTTTETVEPAYKKLLPIQKKEGGNASTGIIGLWLGTTATIPKGWFACDGTAGTPNLTDKYIKCANTTGEIGNTGGSNTHTHAAQAHSHTASVTHTHTGSVAPSGCGQPPRGGGQNFWSCQVNPPHTLASVDSQTVSYANANTTADSSSNQPSYVTAAYIQLVNTVLISGML